MAPDSMGVDQDVFGEVESGIIVFDILCSRLLGGRIGVLYRQDN